MTSVSTHSSGQSFDDVVLPHLGAAYRLARWLMRNDQDAEDVVQDASLRAFRYFGTFTGGDGRAWFLRIVRNACRSRHVGTTPADLDLFDEERHTSNQALPDPEAQLLSRDGASRIQRAMADLPARTREILVLREFEGLSYQELAEALDIPAGTVMSALWRARRALRASLAEEPSHRETRAIRTRGAERPAGGHRRTIDGRSGGNKPVPSRVHQGTKERIDAIVHGRA